MHQKGRCVYDMHSQKIYYCPREHVDGTNIKEECPHLNLDIASGIFYTKGIESLHYLLILNYEWKQESPERTRVVISATMNVEKHHMYRLYPNFHEKEEPEDEPYICPYGSFSSRNSVGSRT